MEGADEAVDALANHPLVLIDNAEHLLPDLAAEIAAWCAAAPETAFVVSSRSLLGLADEEALDSPPLADGAAAELFIHRATMARRDYLATSQDEALEAELVERLDGLPLAIEFAAARTNVLQLGEILSRIEAQQTKLRAPRRHPSRYETLRVAYDGSWELLDETLRRAFRRLGRRGGGEALLDDLVARSLVARDTPERFRLLEIARRYAAEHDSRHERGPKFAGLAVARPNSRLRNANRPCSGTLREARAEGRNQRDLHGRGVQGSGDCAPT